MESILHPWPWYVVGPLIAMNMFILWFMGRKFGMSSNFRTLCGMGGAGKLADFFKFDWKANTWNLWIFAGVIIGGFIGQVLLSSHDGVSGLSPLYKEFLSTHGLHKAGEDLMPTEIFNWESLFTLRGFVFMVVGGFLVGFGARYAGGCTSGHAISGISDLQVPSLVAVAGFFVGGLITTHLLLPYLFQL